VPALTPCKNIYSLSKRMTLTASLRHQNLNIQHSTKFDLTKSSTLIQYMIPPYFVAISRLIRNLCKFASLWYNTMTSRRHHVIKISNFDFVKIFVLVLSIILPNFVVIFQILTELCSLQHYDAMTSWRRYVIEIYQILILRKLLPLFNLWYLQISWRYLIYIGNYMVCARLWRNDVTTFLRHRNNRYLYFLRCTFVQSIIPLNLVMISQEQKFIGLKICALKWRNHVTMSLRYRKPFHYHSCSLTVFTTSWRRPFFDRCFDSVGVSFRVGRPFQVVNFAKL